MDYDNLTKTMKLSTKKFGNIFFVPNKKEKQKILALGKNKKHVYVEKNPAKIVKILERIDLKGILSESNTNTYKKVKE